MATISWRSKTVAPTSETTSFKSAVDLSITSLSQFRLIKASGRVFITHGTVFFNNAIKNTTKPLERFSLLLPLHNLHNLHYDTGYFLQIHFINSEDIICIYGTIPNTGKRKGNSLKMINAVEYFG